MTDGSESYRSTPRPTSRPVSAISSASSGSRSRLLGPRCECGRPHEVSKYCFSCEVVCCAECCFDKHREGCVVKHMKEVVKDIKLSTADEQQLIKKLDTQRKQRQDDLRKLLRQKDQMEPSINKVYDNIRELLSELQKKDIQNGEEKFRDFDENIKQDIEDCTKAVDSLKAVNKSSNKDEHFVKFKQAEKLAKQLEKHLGTESLEYLAQDSAGDNLKAMKFGYFLGELCIELSDYGKFAVPANKVTDDISIHAMCEMPDGTLVVATNILVKLDRDYRAVCETDIQGFPSDMCYVGDGQIAICLKSWRYEGLLQVVTVPTVSRKEISVGLQKDPVVTFSAFIGQRIVFLQEKIFIQDQRDVYTCDKKGKNVTTVYQGSVENGMIDLASDQTRKQIYIADQVKGIVIMDKDGKMLFTVSDPDLHDMCSFCIDKTGQIFVACSTSKRILLLNKKGQKQGVAKCLKKIGEPYRVVLQKNSNRLVIILIDHCELMVYSLPNLDFFSESTHFPVL